MRRGQGKTRGMALIQSLVIVAAIAAVSAALLLRADTARQRLQTRFDGDQLALHLDSGVALIGALIVGTSGEEDPVPSDEPVPTVPAVEPGRDADAASAEESSSDLYSAFSSSVSAAQSLPISLPMSPKVMSGVSTCIRGRCIAEKFM